ncbi:hypothetical protein BLNAU_12074 [Blattamonas nauphoetae]|uniref:Uncharacterized protein n=1 Tax=Blattamonas nauphoetae TaxID=2049346 RepID=A0ABQ9XPG1_9EUKA|nr:hypothetical protein BLNAU_12074 [Blattamonas nauphoetae]
MSSSADVILCRCHPLPMSSSADVILCRCHPLALAEFQQVHVYLRCVMRTVSGFQLIASRQRLHFSATHFRFVETSSSPTTVLLVLSWATLDYADLLAWNEHSTVGMDDADRQPSPRMKNPLLIAVHISSVTPSLHAHHPPQILSSHFEQPKHPHIHSRFLLWTARQVFAEQDQLVLAGFQDNLLF